jgi:hypothetical protein
MSMTLEQALASLDPTNADQWTSDGSPKMDVLQGLTEDASLTRAKVRQVAPNFSKDNPIVGVSSETPAPAGATNQGTVAAPPVVGDDEGEDTPPAEDGDGEMEEAQREEENTLDAEIAGLSDEIAAREAELNEGRKALDELIARKDKLIETREVQQTPHSDQMERMRFIQRQAAMRAERAGNASAARELLKQSNMIGGMPIDLALGARPRQRPGT